MKVLDPGAEDHRAYPQREFARKHEAARSRKPNEIMHALGEWQGEDPATGFHLIKSAGWPRS